VLSLTWVPQQWIVMLDMVDRVELSADGHAATSVQRSSRREGQRKLRLVWSEEL
jgi:hypothetical protein